RVDEARRTLRRFLETAVEPHRTVERRLLIDEDMFQIVAERLQIVVGREILLRTHPGRDCVHDPADQLLDAALAPGRPQLSPEIHRDDDVARLPRPRLRAPPLFPPKKDALSALRRAGRHASMDNVERKLSAQEAGMCLTSGVSTLATQYASRPLGLSSV